MEQTTFKIGDLLVWSEAAWAGHVDRVNNHAREGFTYWLPPAGFYKIVDIDEEEALTYYVQSLENSRYEVSLDQLRLVSDFDLVSNRHQNEAELISSLDDIGLL
jgi:hypothetical protein